MNAKHSNHGGYNVFRSDAGIYFVEEPYLNHAGIRRLRQIEISADYKDVRAYIHQNCMKWMALNDRVGNA